MWISHDRLFTAPTHLDLHSALLNLYLPGMLTEAVISALPGELGAYVATSSEPIRVSGELRVLGQQVCRRGALRGEGGNSGPGDGKARPLKHFCQTQQLSTYVASLVPPKLPPQDSSASKRDAAKQVRGKQPGRVLHQSAHPFMFACPPSLACLRIRPLQPLRAPGH